MRRPRTSKPARRSREEAQRPRDGSMSLGMSAPFGPPFFLKRLAALVRDGCPLRTDGLPLVLLHLVDGESIDVCHVIGLSESWVVVAAHDPGVPATTAPVRMRTVLIPYETILRVSLAEQAADGSHIGFRQDRPPEMFFSESSDRVTAERALALVARTAPPGGGSTMLGACSIPSSHGDAAPEKQPRGSSRRRAGNTRTEPGAES